jgi:3-deoxy-D-manno-octulosonic-acid transferase
VWIAASTHKGEDEQILKAHKALLKSHPTALLIIVPRHPERFDSVFELCRQHGFKTTRRTNHTDGSLKQASVTETIQIYLGDTMGEMLVLLGSADVCLMGGSLIGDKVGGHNVLEPIALGIPTITGPSYYNFNDIVKDLQSKLAITILSNDDDIAETILASYKKSVPETLVKPNITQSIVMEITR